MATKTVPTIDQTTERFQDYTERAQDESRKATLIAVEAYEKAGWGVAEFQARVAKASQVEWLGTVLDAQADLTRTIVSAQSTAARSVLS